MSRVICPECGHRFNAAVTDDQLRFEEDVDWALSVRALRGERVRQAVRASSKAIVDAIHASRPIVTVVSVIRQPPTDPNPDRPQ